MKSIKYKILISFCILAIVTIAVLGIVVSWKLSESISRQSAKLSSDMTTRTHETLKGHTQMLIHNMRADIRRIADNLRKNPDIIHNLETNQINQLTAALELTSRTENIDFAMLFTLEGRLQSSFPYGLNDLEVEEHFNSWTPGRHVQDALYDDSSEEDMIWDIFTQLDPDVFRAFGLDHRESLREMNDFAGTVNTLTKQNLESSERINHATTQDLAPLAHNLVQSVDRFALKTPEP